MLCSVSPRPGAIPDLGFIVPSQAPLEVLKDRECPAMLIPSTPRTSGISEELINDSVRAFFGSPAGFWGGFPS